MKNFYVFQDWVALKLSEMGFKYTSRQDLKDKSRMVYIFENTKEVKQAFHSIMKGSN